MRPIEFKDKTVVITGAGGLGVWEVQETGGGGN